MRKVIVGTLASLMLAMGITVGFSLPAEAHADSIEVTATCNFDTGKFDIDWKLKNDDGHSQTATSRLGTVNIPAHGETHQAESVSVADTYTLSVHGVWSDGFESNPDPSKSITISGVCIKTPVVTHEKEERSIVGEPNCVKHEVVTSNQERKRDVVDGVPGPWSDWETVDTDTRDTTAEECPVVVPPTEPPTEEPPVTEPPTKVAPPVEEQRTLPDTGGSDIVWFVGGVVAVIAGVAIYRRTR